MMVTETEMSEETKAEQLLEQHQVDALLLYMNADETKHFCTLHVEEFDEDGESFAGWVECHDVRGVLWLAGYLACSDSRALLAAELDDEVAA